MAFVYGVAPAGGVDYATSASADTEDAFMAFRGGANTTFSLNSLFIFGKAVAATTLNGIGVHVRRWTTAGSLGNPLTPSPRNSGDPAAVTTCADKQTALTPGTVSGATQLSIGCGGSGPGGWTARDDKSKIIVPQGTSDELAAYSIQGGTSALDFSASAEIEE